MYIEKLKELDIFDLFPSLCKYNKMIFNPIDINILFYTVQIDYTYVFDQIIHLKYPDNSFKISYYKENAYKNNEYAYIIDCNEWNVQDFGEFIVEFSKLQSVIMKPNLFILFNIDNLDKTTQTLIGTLIEVAFKNSRYWFICNHIGKICSKIVNRTMNISIEKNNIAHFKKNLLKIMDKPMFEIMIDKIVEKSNCDYGAALLYLDMLSIDHTILNRSLFSEERSEIKRFIMDKKYTTQHYPKLREICFRLLEKTDLLDIFHNFIIYFKNIFSPEKYTQVISRCAHYQSLDKIPNKQIWLLECWFLDCILIYYNLYDSNKDIYDSNKNTTSITKVISVISSKNANTIKSSLII